MKINNVFIKKRYYDTRVGVTVVSPIIALVNFILLAYNFTVIKTSMNIWVFGIIVTLVLLFVLTVIGIIFRTRQQKIDLGIMYIENKEQLQTDVIILDALKRFYVPDDPHHKTLQKRLDYLNSYLVDN